MTTKKLGKRKCKSCGEVFQKTSMTQSVCSIACAIAHANVLKAKREAYVAKKERSETREKRMALKTIPELIKEAQTAFNAWIRYRDRNSLCICCEKPLGEFATGGDFDCGHYRSRGAAGHLRFNEDNAFGQRKYCNTYLSGNVQGMREGMIKRIGIERVRAIETNNETHKWTKEELIEIKRHYREKLKQAKTEEERKVA
ncbi:MAG: hypothetical protein RLZZ469_1657 [Bacteroidota bacterium]|jgi:hypothetical protein